MGLSNFTYLLLLVAVTIITILSGYRQKVFFRQKLKYLIPAIIFSGAIFILWDTRFEELGIWHFNPEFITGFYILDLPVEEWLFFIVMPACSLYIFELLKIKLPNFEKPNLFVGISLALLVLFALIAYFWRQRLYTFFTFFLLTIYFGYTIFRNRFKPHFTKFYLACFASLLLYFPLALFLTKLPVIEYNCMHILGPRVFTVPVENFAFYFLLLLINTTVYEYLRNQRILRF